MSIAPPADGGIAVRVAAGSGVFGGGAEAAACAANASLTSAAVASGPSPSASRILTASTDAASFGLVGPVAGSASGVLVDTGTSVSTVAVAALVSSTLRIAAPAGDTSGATRSVPSSFLRAAANAALRSAQVAAALATALTSW